MRWVKVATEMSSLVSMLFRTFLNPLKFLMEIFNILVVLGVGGIDKNRTSVFFEKILRYYYIPTIGVADLQAPLNNMMRSS